MLEEKDAAINKLTARLQLREGFTDEADKTQMTLRNEAKRWENKYHELLADFEGYKFKVEEQSISLPIMQKQNQLLKDRIRDLERDLTLMEVEKKVLTGRLETVKEDYTTLRLAQMANKNIKELNNARDVNFKENAIELIRENKNLKDLLRT